MLDASPDRPTLIRAAPAKLNLALAVGPPRPGDGLHPIASWMAPIDLADTLTITRLEPDRLSRYAILWAEDAPVKSPIDWSITKDLAVRAHLLLEQEAGAPLPVQLRLDKRIPVGGGLGGGSSDAAAMLAGVRDLYGLDIGHDRLIELALSLGSDVPYFLGPGPALVTSIGESIVRTPAARGWAVLIFPPFGCPTGAVYRAFDASPSAADGFAERAEAVDRMARAGVLRAGELFNDLAPAAVRVSGDLHEILTRAGAVAGSPVFITGSGSTCFVLCERSAAAHLADDLRDELPGCRVIAVRIGEPG